MSKKPIKVIFGFFARAVPMECGTNVGVVVVVAVVDDLTPSRWSNKAVVADKIGRQP